MTDIEDLPLTEPIHPEFGPRLHQILGQVTQMEESYHLQLKLPVHATSRLRIDEGVGNAASGFNTASGSAASALDHLRTWYQVVASVDTFALPVFSHYTLARAAYEPALLTLWLLDAEADSTHRIGRGYAAQLQMLDDMRKFQDAIGMTGEAANAPMLHARLLAAARLEGHVTATANGGERLTVAVPDMVSLFNRYDQPTPTGKPEWLYRFTSGYAHGRQWAVLRGAVEHDLDGFDTGMNSIRADVQTLCYLAQRVVSVVARAVAVHIRYRTQPQSTIGA